MSYYDLCAIAPETAKAIDDCIIEMTVATSLEAAALVAFAKHEYDTVNLKVEGLKAGEIIRTGADETRSMLETKIKSALKRTLKPKDRDAHLEELRALVHGAAGLVTQMNKKKGTLTTTKPLTDEQVAKAEATIESLAKAEETIASLPELSDKKLQARVKNRNLDLAVDGTFVYALQDARNEDECEEVISNWVRFHKEFFPVAKKWTETLSILRKATVDRSRYGPEETPFPARWKRIQNMLNPRAAIVSSANVPVVAPL
jgi:chromosome segregation ATPase